MDNLVSKKKYTIDKLGSLLKKEYNKDFFVGLLKSFSILLMLFLFLSFLESIFFFTPSVRTGIIFFLFTALLLFFIIWIVKPLIKSFKHYSSKEINKAAETVGNYFPNIKDNLLNSLQLLYENNHSSKNLTIAAFQKVYNQISNYDFLEVIDYSALKKNSKIFFTILSIFISSVLIFPSINSAAVRLLNFNSEYAKPSEFLLKVITGDAKIKKGNSITLNIKGDGKLPDFIHISNKTKYDSEFSKHNVKRDSNNNYKLNLNNIKHSFKYFASAGDVKTKEFFVVVVDPPIINSLSLDIIHPKYSQLPIEQQHDNGNITALFGTTVKFNISSTKELSKASIIKSDTTTTSLKINNSSANGSMQIRNNFSYTIHLSDKDSNKNETPITYLVKTIPDKHPLIKITSPAKSSLLPNNDIVNIVASIKDDFGFSKLNLLYQVIKPKQKNIDTEFKRKEVSLNKMKLEQDVFYNWDFSKMIVREKDVINFYLEIFDNDYVSGPKSTKSENLKIRIPTLDELFMQAEQTQDEATKNIEDIFKEAKDLQKDLSELKNELKRNEKKIDWNEKEKVKNSTEKFKDLNKKIDEVQKNLDKMQKEMNQNDLLSEETMRLYDELQNLMDEINNSDLKKALEKMQKSMQQMNRDEIQKSLNDLAMNEEAFQKSIERTLNLLKKIQIEQKIDEVIKRTEKIENQLNSLKEKVKDNLNNKNSNDKNELANEQKDIGDQINQLKNELDKLNEKMKEVEDTPQQQMEQVKNDFDNQKNSEVSEQAKQNMQNQNMQKAQQNQQQLSQNMNETKKQMQQIKNAMQQQNQQVVLQNMMMAINNLISISKEQEQLKQNTENLKSQPSKLPKTAQEQLALKQNLENTLREMNKLAQKSFAVTPEMGKALGKARQNMNDATKGLQNKNGNRSGKQQGEAMQNLNEATSLMQQALQQMMQGDGSGSGGMMSLMQQLKQMANKQMGLNQQTQGMKPGQFSMQQQAQMQRLAKEQGAIQKSLSELNKEARASGKSKKLATNLEKIIEEMNEVVSGLNTKKLDDNLIQKQEKILSKLLDAQRSINERDFEKNRESNVGNVFNNKSPGELNLSDEKIKDNLREELMKAIQEGYSKDYEDLIHRYFEELGKTNGN